MPSKFKKAIAAVKDQTSISLAKVGGAESSSLEVAILKATTHDEVPIDERHVTEVLQLVSSNRSYAGSCARAIGRRIGRTRSWVVAVKSLMVVLRIFQDGDPHFPKEVLHAMKRGYKILNLSSFRDDSSTSCPWDFTAFVRTFALYLDERLDCFLTGKLQRRTSYHQSGGATRGYGSRKKEPIVRDMKPAMLLDRISHWQRLLDRAIATRPTGAAKTNRLVQTCLYAIVQETFDLYRDISDGLALLLDSFFHLQYNNCVSAFQTCVKASKQFEELCSFYDTCKTIGVGRTPEYPSIQKVSQELLETLQEFLKDQSSFPASNGRVPTPPSTGYPPLPGPVSPRGSGRRDRAVSEFGGSHCTSLEDLISADSGFSPERYSDPGGEKLSTQMEEYFSANDTTSVRSDPTDHRGVNSGLDLFSSPPPELQDQSFESINEESSTSGQGWELALFETETSNHNQDWITSVNGNANTTNQSSSWVSPTHNYNPFLQDFNGGNDDLFGAFAQTNGDFSLDSFPAELGLGFEAEFGNNNGNNMGGFPTDLGTVNKNGNGFPPTFQSDFTNSNVNISADFAPTFRADFGNNNVDLSDLFSDLGVSYNQNPSVSTTFPDEVGNTFNRIPDDLGNNGSANAMNAIVPFGQVVGNNDLFSTVPSFQATPTFRATSLDMDQMSSLQYENDPFGSLPTRDQMMGGSGSSLDQQSVLLQQQLWLQNQSKIIARHLT